MAKLLYITAHPFQKDTYSLAVGEQFLKSYQEAHPDDEVIHLDLYRMDLPLIDADLLRRWGQPPSGASFDELSEASKAKAIRMHEIVDQFVAADKVVIVNPVWNYSIPPLLLAYLDAIIVPGKTFGRADNGRRGLGGLKGMQQSKKAMHIQASGTVLSHGEFEEREFSHRYVEAILKFLGIDDVQVIFVEGTSEKPDQAATIKEQAIQQAISAARQF